MLVSAETIERVIISVVFPVALKMFLYIGYTGLDKIVYDDPNHIRIEVTAAQRGVVVLSESSYPGWRVTVNGEPANIICLNYLFQGVEVESGRQLIQFEYQPPFFRLYLLISGFTFLAIMLVCISRCSVKRKI